MIQDGETGVLTGGSDGSANEIDKVTRYNRDGMVEILPSINIARRGHACSSLDIDGKKVCNK